jgi:tRNA-binding EMAP/Myf-like protein
VTELIVGRVLAVEDHPGSRAPSYLLRVDLGGRGEREAQMDPGDYTKDELVGSLLVLSIDDEAIVLAAHSHAGLKLVRPDGDVEPGTVVA